MAHPHRKNRRTIGDTSRPVYSLHTLDAPRCISNPDRGTDRSGEPSR